MKSVLIIQTAFIGDVILATALVESIRSRFPEVAIDFLLRGGNESILANHPKIRRVMVWEKRHRKFQNLSTICREVRNQRYDLVVNTHRFASSGWITWRSGAKTTVGFDKNPLAFLFTKKVKHTIGTKAEIAFAHEIDRNHQLLGFIPDIEPKLPRLYPSKADIESIKPYANHTFITIAPTSVWYTKQWPSDKWIEFIKLSPLPTIIIGGPADASVGDMIKSACPDHEVENLAGKLTFLQSAALMARATMNYTNDSGPLHMATAMDAPVTAIYCSTIPEFGFGPKSSVSQVVETSANLDCRPCGLHGHKACPKGHFDCARTINPEQLLDALPKT